MKTVNISLTLEQAKAIDLATNNLGFANRSELFRALIRTFLRKPEVLVNKDSPMQSPNTKSARKVLTGFKETGKYSKTFLKDLEGGLRDSDYFINDLPSK